MRYTIVFLFLVSGVSAFSQRTFIAAKIGMGNYSMSSQKKLQTTFLEESGLPLRRVDNFPAYLTYDADLGIEISENSSLGLSFGLNSTGGRLHYKDYSGHAVIDQKLKAFSFGVFYELKLNRSDKWGLYAAFQASVFKSKLDLITEVAIGSESVTETLSFKSTNFAFCPGINAQKKVNRVFFKLGFGYEGHMDGRLHSKDIDQLSNSKGEEVTAEWDGFRSYAGIGFVLGKRSEIELKD